MTKNILEVAALLERAVLAAANYQIQTLSSGVDLHVTKKSDSSLVTLLDLESQKLIKEILGSSLPIVAEEDEDSHSLVGNTKEYFIIDPLDGTTACKRFTNFRGGQVGFGPLIGYVADGQVQAASFFSVPQRNLVTAIKGQGCYLQKVEDTTQRTALPEIIKRHRLQIQTAIPLDESAILFHSFTGEELPLVAALMKNKVVETSYRFGGFASDCARLAQGLEQLQIQYTVKAWDFSACLFSAEAGLQVLCDPLGKQALYDDWQVALKNPIITAHKDVMPTVKEWLQLTRNVILAV